MARVNVNNANFYYEIHGTGKPVILIAGYTCDHTIWQPILDKLSQHFQVIIFDNRGVGQTEDNNELLSTKLMADDVIALSDELDLKKPHIVGQSMGGTIAQAVASNYPDKIGKLCIITSSAKWRLAMLCGLKSLLTLREKNIDFELIFKLSLPWIYGESFLNSDKNIADRKQAILDNPFPQSLANQLRQFKSLEEFDGAADLKNIKAATLVAYGIQDLITLPVESEYMANQISQSTLIHFDCAHGITHELPEQLTQALIDFLKDSVKS